MITANRKLNVLIVDDEPLARRRIRELLASEERVHLLADCGDGDEAVAAIGQYRPDLVFLDVQMPGKNGFQVIEAVGVEAMPKVIFVTAYDAHAIAAFEVCAVDYLLKPFDDRRFQAAFHRALVRLEESAAADLGRSMSEVLKHWSPDPAPQARSFLQRFLVKKNGRSLVIPVTEVDWLEAEDVYLRLHYGDHSALIRDSLSAVETKLDPREFVRIHRSTIVRLDRVKMLKDAFRGSCRVILNSGVELKVSRSKRDQLERRLSRT